MGHSCKKLRSEQEEDTVSLAHSEVRDEDQRTDVGLSSLFALVTTLRETKQEEGGLGPAESPHCLV